MQHMCTVQASERGAQLYFYRHINDPGGVGDGNDNGTGYSASRVAFLLSVHLNNLLSLRNGCSAAAAAPRLFNAFSKSDCGLNYP